MGYGASPRRGGERQGGEEARAPSPAGHSPRQARMQVSKGLHVASAEQSVRMAVDVHVDDVPFCDSLVRQVSQSVEGVVPLGIPVVHADVHCVLQVDAGAHPHSLREAP